MYVVPFNFLCESSPGNIIYHDLAYSVPSTMNVRVTANVLRIWWDLPCPGGGTRPPDEGFSALVSKARRCNPKANSRIHMHGTQSCLPGEMLAWLGDSICSVADFDTSSPVSYGNQSPVSCRRVKVFSSDVWYLTQLLSRPLLDLPALAKIPQTGQHTLRQIYLKPFGLLSNSSHLSRFSRLLHQSQLSTFLHRLKCCRSAALTIAVRPACQSLVLVL
jgi:hypothetical protein